MNTICCRMEPKKFWNYKGRKSHDMRQEGRVPNYVDTELVVQNSIIIATPSSIQALEMMNEVKKAAKARQAFDKDKNTLLYDGLLSFSYQARVVVHDLSREEQDRRMLLSARAVCELHGGQLIGLTVHRDETSIHSHFQMLGVGNDGRLLRINRVDCSLRQDVAALAWMDLGITRGKKKAKRLAEGEKFSETVHRSVRELHEDLPRKLEELSNIRKNLQEECSVLLAAKKELYEEYWAILDRLGVAKEVLQADTGISGEFAENAGSTMETNSVCKLTSSQKSVPFRK